MTLWSLQPPCSQSLPIFPCVFVPTLKSNCIHILMEWAPAPSISSLATAPSPGTMAWLSHSHQLPNLGWHKTAPRFQLRHPLTYAWMLLSDPTHCPHCHCTSHFLQKCLLPPRVYTSRKLESGVWSWYLTQLLWYRKRESKLLVKCSLPVCSFNCSSNQWVILIMGKAIITSDTK